MQNEIAISGSVVRARRQIKEWTQGELAYHAQVDQGQISKIENGHLTDVALSTARRLAAALGVTLDQIAGLAAADIDLNDPELEAMLKEVGGELDEAEREGVKAWLRHAKARRDRRDG